MILLIAGAILTGFAGALALYLVSPNQRLLRAPMPSRAGVGVGIVLLAFSLLLFRGAVAADTAVFMLLVVLTVAWSLLPFLGVWRMKAREKKHG
ncbi:MAG: hypothetical protein EP335_11495 [Alphaproteobacteria bacterium]|nr:MAG: hypothetical protein EP335_11495 [Alphaproteobacteria bacterium]